MQTRTFFVDLVAQALGTLTSDATNPATGGTITIGTQVYTVRTALTTPAVANEILIGANAAATLDNIKSAVNADPAGEGTLYSTGTEANEDVIATTNTNTTQVFVARQYGSVGNSIATTETCTHLSFGAATLASGSGTMTTVYAPTWGRLVQIAELQATAGAFTTDFVAQRNTDDDPLLRVQGSQFNFYKGMNDQQFRPEAICGYVGALTAAADFTAESGNNTQ